MSSWNIALYVYDKFRFGRIRLLIKLSMFDAKFCLMSCQGNKLLKYFKALVTISSYYGSLLALAHNVQICYINPLIDSSTSSLYLLAYSRIDCRAAPLHLKNFSLRLGNCITLLRMRIHSGRLSSKLGCRSW